ncbi:MAG: hypothetical protein WAU25_08255 [Nitrososphaeraceae archaeon]|jgi:hypothetical protein
MGKVNLTINDDLEEAFREAAYKVKGMKKGFLTEATEEAISVWLKYVQMNLNETKKLTARELKSIEDIDSGKVRMIDYPNAKDFVKQMRTSASKH